MSSPEKARLQSLGIRVGKLDGEATKNQAETLWTATYLLMGLKYSDELIDRLLEGVQNMEESVTYQKILKKGRGGGSEEDPEATRKQAIWKTRRPHRGCD